MKLTVVGNPTHDIILGKALSHVCLIVAKFNLFLHIQPMLQVLLSHTLAFNTIIRVLGLLLVATRDRYIFFVSQVSKRDSFVLDQITFGVLIQIKLYSEKEFSK